MLSETGTAFDVVYVRERFRGGVGVGLAFGFDVAFSGRAFDFDVAFSNTSPMSEPGFIFRSWQSPASPVVASSVVADIMQ